MFWVCDCCCVGPQCVSCAEACCITLHHPVTRRHSRSRWCCAHSLLMMFLGCGGVEDLNLGGVYQGRHRLIGRVRVWTSVRLSFDTLQLYIAQGINGIMQVKSWAGDEVEGGHQCMATHQACIVSWTGCAPFACGRRVPRPASQHMTVFFLLFRLTNQYLLQVPKPVCACTQWAQRLRLNYYVLQPNQSKLFLPVLCLVFRPDQRQAGPARGVCAGA